MEKKFAFAGLGLSRFLQMPFNVVLARRLPWSWLRLYIIGMGFLYFAFHKKERRNIRKVLRHVIGGDRKFSGSIFFCGLLLKTYVGIFEHYYEKLVMAHRSLPALKGYFRKRLAAGGHASLVEAAASGKGAILVTGHFGAVEFFPLALHVLGIPVAMICRFKTNSLRHNLFAKAVENGVTLIDADEPNVAIRALKEVAKGKVLITECDEFKAWRGYDDKRVKVFGHSLPMDKTLDFFYRRSGAPVFLGLIRRDRGRLHLEVEQIADGRQRVLISEAAWTLLEKNILRYPDQWYQWKDAYKTLEQFINETQEAHEAQQLPYLPAQHPLPSAHLP